MAWWARRWYARLACALLVQSLNVALIVYAGGEWPLPCLINVFAIVWLGWHMRYDVAIGYHVVAIEIYRRRKLWMISRLPPSQRAAMFAELQRRELERLLKAGRKLERELQRHLH